MDRIWQDVKYGLRALRRGKGLIAIAVLSLGIGIGANVSIFSAVDVFMLRPLPYPDSDDLYAAYTTNLERGWNRVSYSVPDFLDLRERSQTIGVAALNGASFNLSGGDRPERLRGQVVSADFFQVLGVGPAMGRGFTPEEEREGLNHVAIISDGLWQRRFGADPNVLGSTVLLDGEVHTIIGVMPPKFWFGWPGNEIWAPIGITGEETRNSHYLDVLVRVGGGTSKDLAQQEVQRIAEQLAVEFPESNRNNGGTLITLHERVFGEGFKMGTLISTVAVLFLLLIACANVANLLLTHAAGRDREVAVRNALGADRTRIVRQFLTEAAIISVMGGLLGLALSVIGIRALVSVMPGWFPRVDEIGLDGRVLLYAAGVSLLTSILVGLAPALQSSKPNTTETLKEGGRGGTAGKSMRLRKALVVGEVSLTLVLLVSSALLVQAFVRVRLADLGFDHSDVLTLRVALPENDYPDTVAIGAFHERLASRIASIPGVEAVGATSIFPLQGNSATYYWLPGEVIEDDSQRKIANYRYVLPGYFAAMDVPVVRGRGLEEGDRAGMRLVAVIDETMAEKHWPESDPIGQRIELYSGPREIVGVVADTRLNGAGNTVRPMVYLAALQSMSRSLGWVIETRVPPESVIEAVRAEVRSIDPNIPAYGVRSMRAMIDETLGGDTIMAKIMGVVAVIALVLSLAGVYGVMAYTVSQRTQELGIRIALGAQTGDVLSMVVRQGALLALIGVVVGIGVALGVTRGLSFFLFDVSPFDPLTFGAVAIALLVAGLVATYFPARRATRVDPIVALRAE
jgi:putative ABC transport system permease protein